MTNLVDRFHAAVTVLAGDGHIKQRLIHAYQDNLAEIEDDELPVAVREGFAELTQRMHSVAPLNGEGPIRASVRKMSCSEAGQCGESVVALYADILRLADTLPEARPPAEEAPVVPAFLVK
ncbi:MAG: hypothetical protein R3288_11650 [Woeseiaceae bacterium]|nr:hypothetical protein [Woeseiaceae bacterium]